MHKAVRLAILHQVVPTVTVTERTIDFDLHINIEEV